MNKKLVFLASMFALAAMIPTTTHGGLRRGEHHENEHSISKRPESEGEAEEIKEAWEKAADDFSHIEEDRREEIKKLYQETQDLVDEITQEVLASLAEVNIEEHFESMQYSLTLPNDNFPNLASSEEVDTKISNISPNISTVFDNFNLETIETRSFHLLNFEKNILHIKGDEGPTEGIFFLTKYALMGMPSSSFPSPEAEKLGNKFAEIYKSYYTPEEFWSQFSSQLFKNASPTVADLVIHLEYVKQLGAILESYNYQSREEKLDYVQKLVDFYNSPKGNLSDMFKKVSEIAKVLPRSFQADILQQALGEILFQQRDIKDLPMDCEDLRLINCRQKRKRTENEKVGVETRKKAKDSEDSSRQSNANFVRETKKKRNTQEMEEAFKTALGGYEISENDDPNEIAKKFSEVAGVPNSDKTRSYQVTAYVELKEDIVIGEKASRHVFATLVKPETSDRISRTAEKVNAHVLTRELEKEGKKDFRHAEILIFELLVKEHCKKLKDKCEFACESTDWSKIGIDLSKYIVGGKIGVSKFICPQCNKHLSDVKISSNQEVSGRKSPHWFTPFKGVKCPGNLFSSIIRTNIKTVKASTDPLFIAVNKGDYKTVQDLLLKGVDPDIRDVYNEMTPLLVAMDNFYDSVADLMLSLGASPTLADMFGQTPLIYASQNLLESSFYHLCNMDLPKEIVDQQDCQIGFSALHLATENHHVGMVTSLADLGADINIVSTEGSQTSLHLATMNSDIEIANVLLSYGADVNLENDDGETPLQLMIRNDMLSSLLLALELEGSNVNLDLAKRIANEEKKQEIIDLLNLF